VGETASKTLLAIIELGGYPDFSPLYRNLGFEVVIEGSMRRALGYLKRHAPAVVVAEFNYQSGFRDRLSNLESLMAAIQRRPQTRVIVFYEQEVAHQFDRLRQRFAFFEALAFPIDPRALKATLRRV
jgi:hypothetical protein